MPYNSIHYCCNVDGKFKKKIKKKIKNPINDSLQLIFTVRPVNQTQAKLVHILVFRILVFCPMKLVSTDLSDNHNA